MTIRNLEFALHPRSVAVFGASERAGSVGTVLMAGIPNGGVENSGRCRRAREGRYGVSSTEEGLVTNPDVTGQRTLTGMCLCGAVHYAVADAFACAANCHCSQCRRATGAAFKPFAGIERRMFRVTKGEGNLMRFGDASAHDARCGTCGSFLYSVVRDGAFVHVTLGTLVDERSIRPTQHIFVGSRAPWFTITDDLPRHAEFPEGGAR